MFSKFLIFIFRFLSSSYSIPLITRLQFHTLKTWLDENGEFHRLDGPAWVRSDGYIKWFSHGQLHRENGPAKIFPLSYSGNSKGTEFWFHFGKLHREDGPAVIKSDGTTKWYRNSLLHREAGPAIEWPSGVKEWWLNGRRHRLNGPAVEGGKSIQWYLHGKLHRSDGPAVVTELSYTPQATDTYKGFYEPGATEWWWKGERHRNDGPALIKQDGSARWYRYGKLHRSDGPAVEYKEGSKEWWISGRVHRSDGPAFEAANGYNILRNINFKIWELEPRSRSYNLYIPNFSIEVRSDDLHTHILRYEQAEEKEWWLKGKNKTEEEFKKLTKHH